MFVSKNQFYVFIVCLAIGVVGGLIFNVLSPIKDKINKKWINTIIDIFAFIILSIIYVFIAFRLHFPSFRVYMIVGVLAGIYLYNKSFKIILAKLNKKIYNILEIILKKKRKSTNDRKQI